MNSTTKISSSAPYVGYVMKRYPRFSETFIVNEILAHERAGMKLDIFALGQVQETHFQDAIAQVRAPVTRYNEKQRHVDSFWALFQQASKVIPNFYMRSAALCHKNPHELAQGVMLAMAVCQRGIQHLHAHFGTRATTITRLASLLTGVSYTFTAHAKDIYYPYEESTNLEQKLADAAQTITVSDYNLTYLKEKYGDNANKTVRIYNGIELKRFVYSKPENRPRHILAVGRLVAKKGFEVLIDALAILKDRGVSIDCSIIGDGVLQSALKTRIQEAGLKKNVVLTGQKPQPDIIAAMASTAMVVAPCVISEEGDRDGLPTVLLEAMALGAPVISTDVAGIPELVRNEKTGLCVEPNNPHALADAMQRLLDDVPLRCALSHEARQLIEREYDIDKNTARLREIFTQSVLQNAPLSITQ